MNPENQQGLTPQPSNPYAAPAAPAAAPQAGPPPGQPQAAPGNVPYAPLGPATFNTQSAGPVPPMGQVPAAIPPAPGTPPAPHAQVKSNPNSTQNSLHIAEIRDGIVIMSDGTFRSVVMVKSINFDLMSPQERDAVEYAYQGFLNSLYFPIQIFIRSQKVDIQPYITKLDKIRSEHDNMLLALMMEDYIGYIEALAQQTNIMDKKFYVVIPYFPELNVKRAVDSGKGFLKGLKGVFGNTDHHVVVNEADLVKAKDELRNRVQAVLGGLIQSGIQGLPLDTQELIELYYDTYNPDTATRQQLKNFNDLTAPVVTKGQGQAPQPNLEKELL